MTGQASGMPGHRRFVTVLAACVCLAGVTSACGNGGRAESLPSVAASPADVPTPPATAAPRGTPSAAVTSSAPEPSGNIGPCAEAKLSLTTDKPTYAAGQTMHLTATLSNGGTVTCTVQSSAERGFTVSRAGTAIWRSGCSGVATGHTAVEPCAQFITLLPLKPGQRQTRIQAWSQQADGTDKQVPAGSYLLGETWAGLKATVAVTIS